MKCVYKPTFLYSPGELKQPICESTEC